jgi:hypothetical protein
MDVADFTTAAFADRRTLSPAVSRNMLAGWLRAALATPGLPDASLDQFSQHLDSLVSMDAVSIATLGPELLRTIQGLLEGLVQRRRGGDGDGVSGEDGMDVQADTVAVKGTQPRSLSLLNCHAQIVETLKHDAHGLGMLSERFQSPLHTHISYLATSIVMVEQTCGDTAELSFGQTALLTVRIHVQLLLPDLCSVGARGLRVA